VCFHWRGEDDLLTGYKQLAESKIVKVTDFVLSFSLTLPAQRETLRRWLLAEMNSAVVGVNGC
jgi:hypothetical protein